jgi:hypothetical protein
MTNELFVQSGVQLATIPEQKAPMKPIALALSPTEGSVPARLEISATSIVRTAVVATMTRGPVNASKGSQGTIAESFYLTRMSSTTTSGRGSKSSMHRVRPRRGSVQGLLCEAQGRTDQVVAAVQMLS